MAPYGALEAKHFDQCILVQVGKNVAPENGGTKARCYKGRKGSFPRKAREWFREVTEAYLEPSQLGLSFHNAGVHFDDGLRAEMHTELGVNVG